MKHIRLFYDENCESPLCGQNNTLVSFCSKHTAYKHPSEIGFDSDQNPTKEMQSLLDNNLAFKLSFHSHGSSYWFLQGHGNSGSNCPFDTVSFAGVLILNEPDYSTLSLEQRFEAAKSILEEYNQWSNGGCYAYEIYDVKTCEHCSCDEKTQIDSCYGFFSSESMFETISENVKKDEEVVFYGPCKWLAEYHNLHKGK